MNVRRPSRSTVLGLMAYGLLALILLPFALLLLASVLNGFGSYVVVSNSMAPRFQSGDVVFVQKTGPATVEPGDAIVYEDSDGQRVTHQVVEVVRKDGHRYFRTKGLANEEPDPSLVAPEQTVGVVMFAIPYLGVAVTFLQTDLGVLLFLLLPAVLLFVTEAWDVATTVRRDGGSESDDGGPPPSADGSTDPSSSGER